MTKIEINLSPQKAKASSQILRSITSYTPLLALVAIGVLVLIFFLQVVALKKTHSERVYAKKWQGWVQREQSLKKIKSENVDLEKEEKTLKEILDSKHEAAAVLEDIYTALPKNIWFKEMSFRNDFINIKGYVVNWNEDYMLSLDKFINSLVKNTSFSSKFGRINIKQSQKANYNGVEVLDFVVECKR